MIEILFYSALAATNLVIAIYHVTHKAPKLFIVTHAFIAGTCIGLIINELGGF